MGAFDGAGPGEPATGSWKGILTLLVVVTIILVVIFSVGSTLMPGGGR